MKKVFLSYILIFFYFIGAGQGMIKGKVIDKDSKTPIENVNVYISNSSIGTRTDANGYFTLRTPSAGKFELVLSSMGYATKMVPLVLEGKLDNLIIDLSSKANDLPEVVLRTYIKNGWKLWGKFFLEQFIGSYPINADCKILNPNVIHFQFKRKDSVLKAFAEETILVENKKLGYLLHYDLIEFSHDFLNNRTFYQGYPFFEDLKNSETKKVINKREEVYKGSLMHFMRSVFTNQIKENNFEVRKMVKILDRNGAKIIIDGNANLESTDQVRYEMASDYLVGDSIAYGISDNTVGMYFKNYLLVAYKNKQAPYFYTSRYRSNFNLPYISSELTLLLNEPLMVYPNGSFAESNNLLLSGYLGWAEKLGNMLPFDYKPIKK
jgi:hypothetical protein